MPKKGVDKTISCQTANFKLKTSIQLDLVYARQTVMKWFVELSLVVVVK
jgi:hypothetical protein